MKSAGQVIAVESLPFAFARNGDTLKTFLPARRKGPGVGNERDTGQASFQSEPLHDLCRLTYQSDPEAGETAPRRLLADDGNRGAALMKISRNCEQQRARSGHDHALAANRKTRLDHRLQSPGS